MPDLLWVTKTAESRSLSQSDGQERLDILSQAQAVSRRQKSARRKSASRSTVVTVRTAIEIRHEHKSEQGNTHIDQRSSESDYSATADDWFESDWVHLETESVRANFWSPPLFDSPQQWNPDQSTDERRSAVYFHEVTVNKILTIQRDKIFWKGIVPYLAEVDTGIRHLVVAIAATYELLSKPRDVCLNQFALTQCNKAVRVLLSSKRSRASLIASSILIVAYNLLRTDIEAADRGIESGLKMLRSLKGVSEENSLTEWSHILVTLSEQHGYKLWAPEVAFRVERTVASSEDICIEAKFPKGPFTNVEQVLSAFKIMMLDFVARVMRNIALGAYVDPRCTFAQDVGENFSMIFFHWKMFYQSLSEAQANEKLQLMQLKIGLLLARLLFHTKLLAADELRTDRYIDVFEEIQQLARRVIAARHAGHPVVYIDRIVNGALYTCAMFCRQPEIRRRFIWLLKSQLEYSDGLVNFLRGHTAEIVAEIEEHGLVVDNCHAVPECRRIGICTMSRLDGGTLRVGYMTAIQTDRDILNHHESRMPAELDQYTDQEINDCLSGMMGAYAMYRKLDLSKAPNGCLRRMFYGGRPVNIVWRDSK